MDCSIPAGDGLVGLYVNRAPMLVDDSVSTQPASPVTIDVLANDDATWDSGTISSSYPTATELAAQDDVAHVPAGSLATALAVVAHPSNGAVAIGPDGHITYTPNSGFIGTDSFVYSLTDNDGASSEAAVTIEVAGPMGDPQLAATGAGIVPAWLAMGGLLVFAGAGLVMRSRKA
jgi:LPXTG-motif cell wall-anchored protein